MNNHKLEVYDPAMCCSTGVCGPSIDQKLVQFAADLKWLQDQGIEVRRFNLAQNPTAFVENELVKAALAEKNEAALPLLLVDGRIVASGHYVGRNELADWLGLEVPPSSGCCGGNDADPQPISTCGAECSCHSSQSSGKMRMVVGIIVLLAAGTLVVRAITKSEGNAPKPAEPTFATPAALQPATTPEEKPATPKASVGTTIGAFSELNLLAAANDAVFLYLPGKDETTPSTAMTGAAQKIEGQGMKCGLFTMKAGSPDYDKIAGQITIPAVLALVKGRGMSAISGEITEEKLIQGYVAASRSGGCGSGGCAPSGCK